MKTEGLWLVVYHHRHGVEAHVVSKEGKPPTKKEVIEALDLDFDGSDGDQEWLDISPVDEIPVIGVKTAG